MSNLELTRCPKCNQKYEEFKGTLTDLNAFAQNAGFPRCCVLIGTCGHSICTRCIRDAPTPTCAICYETIDKQYLQINRFFAHLPKHVDGEGKHAITTFVEPCADYKANSTRLNTHLLVSQARIESILRQNAQVRDDQSDDL